MKIRTYFLSYFLALGIRILNFSFIYTDVFAIVMVILCKEEVHIHA